MQADIAPPIAAVFLLGVLGTGGNERGAMAALMTGFVIGLGRLIAEINKATVGDGFLFTFADVNFLHFAAILFVICTLVLIGVSLATAPPPHDKVAGLTFQTTEEPLATAVSARERSVDVLLSAGVVLAVCAVWWYFS